jgi:hypothetical protein
MEIFHTVVMPASTATLTSMHPKYQDSCRGAPSATISVRPAATDAMMNDSTMSLGRLAPTYLSSQRPRRMPRAMNSVGSTPAKNAASSPQPRPATPSACQPMTMTVAIIQFFGSSRYVTRSAADLRVTGSSRATGNHQSGPAGKPVPDLSGGRSESYVPRDPDEEEAAAHARTHRRGIP